MADAAYEAAVKNTFETKPLRTVLLIDDEFPTFADLVRGETDATKKKFAQKDRAFGLYEGFRKRRMICDVENQVAELEMDRFRKSDLIILDYHLGPGATDTDTSLRVLRDLSASKHFNTVIVYTAQSELDEVWLDIVATLSGGWTGVNLDGDALAHWDHLYDKNEIPDVNLDAVKQFAMRRRLRDLHPRVRSAVYGELVELGVPEDACDDIMKAMIDREMARRAGLYAKEPHQPTVGDYREGVHWIQAHNSFVSILQKERDSDADDGSERLMSFLNRALQAWRPNLFQILVSEIQNILELEALATADRLLGDPTTHTGLWYYLLETLGQIDPASNPNVKAPLLNVIDKVVDGIRRRLSTDEELLGLASRVLLGELRDAGWTKETWPQHGQAAMGTAALRLARTKGTVTMSDVFFRLNSFVGTEEFKGGHLTTGTICSHTEENDYFVIASPACDLVARQPRDGQAWAHAIHPLTPVVAIRLEPVRSIESALSQAARGQHIFLESGKDKKVFKIVNESGQPSYEFFFATCEGRVHEKDGKIVLDVARLISPTGTVSAPTHAAEGRKTDYPWVKTTLEVIGQLRDANAARVLQLAGQHLSRVGLDFLDKPSG